MMNSSSPLLFLFLLYLHLFTRAHSQLCPRFCGPIPLFYPFGGGPGCGDPHFAKYITCNQKHLTLTTHIGSYPITSIDYDHKVLHLSDPTMSTCFNTEPSRGFGLNSNAPFSFDDSTIFLLIGCSVESSPIYRNDIIKGNTNTSNVPQCANVGTTLCTSIYSCQPIRQLSVTISTCCVYAPVDLGPAYEMDLNKLHCKGYTAVYSFNGRETEPMGWSYGIALKYKFNAKNNYPEYCRNCEKSGGVCAYTGTYNTFTCNCLTEVNTTIDCYLQLQSQSAALSDAHKRLLQWRKGRCLLSFVALFLFYILL